ncbi:hypothetical protein AAT19DRAFT_14381, partial [Rhodotorula toruloides]
MPPTLPLEIVLDIVRTYIQRDFLDEDWPAYHSRLAPLCLVGKYLRSIVQPVLWSHLSLSYAAELKKLAAADSTISHLFKHVKAFAGLHPLHCPRFHAGKQSFKLIRSVMPNVQSVALRAFGGRVVAIDRLGSFAALNSLALKDFVLSEVSESLVLANVQDLSLVNLRVRGYIVTTILDKAARRVSGASTSRILPTTTSPMTWTSLSSRSKISTCAASRLSNSSRRLSKSFARICPPSVAHSATRRRSSFLGPRNHTNGFGDLSSFLATSRSTSHHTCSSKQRRSSQTRSLPFSTTSRAENTRSSSFPRLFALARLLRPGSNAASAPSSTRASTPMSQSTSTTTPPKTRPFACRTPSFASSTTRRCRTRTPSRLSGNAGGGKGCREGTTGRCGISRRALTRGASRAKRTGWVTTTREAWMVERATPSAKGGGRGISKDWDVDEGGASRAPRQ